MASRSLSSRGWQVGVSLQDRLYHMLTHEVDCDVTFVFPHSKPPSKIRAHKLVLKAGFEAMFSGNFAETDNDVEIVDITSTVFAEMLRYLYTDSGNVTAENVLPLMFAAEKYIIDGLTVLCTSFLTNDLNDDNVCTILNDSLVYAVESLAETCCKFISSRTESVIKTPGFRNMSQDALLILLRYDKVNIDNEILMYEACVTWARQQTTGSPSNQDLRTKLGRCLHEIRFHSMKFEEFADKIGNVHDILNDEEKSRIYGHLISKSEATKEKLGSLGFNMCTRQAAIIKVPCYKPGSAIQYGVDGNASETLTFSYTAGPRIKLQGVSIYGGQKEGDTHNITLKFMREDPSGLCLDLEKTEGTINATGNTHPLDIKLNQPHIIEIGYQYVLTVESRGPNMYYKKDQWGDYLHGNMGFCFNFEGRLGGGAAYGQNSGFNQNHQAGRQFVIRDVFKQQRIAELILSQC